MSAPTPKCILDRGRPCSSASLTVLPCALPYLLGGQATS